jgi:hypothetical protein
VCAKIADFGLSLVVTERLRDPLPTWEWMAPEAQAGIMYTELCDLYSFGVVLWEIADGQGRVPFSEVRLLDVRAPWPRSCSSTQFEGKMRIAQVKQQALAGTLRPTLHPRFHALFLNLIPRLWSNDPCARPSFVVCASELSIETKLPFKFCEYERSLHTKVLPVNTPTRRIILQKEKLEGQPTTQIVSGKAWVAWDTGVVLAVDFISHKVVERLELSQPIGRMICTASGKVVGCNARNLYIFQATGQNQVVTVPLVAKSALTCLIDLPGDNVLVCDQGGNLTMVSNFLKPEPTTSPCALQAKKVTAGCAVSGKVETRCAAMSFGDSLPFFHAKDIWLASADGIIYCANLADSEVTALSAKKLHDGKIVALVVAGGFVWSFGGSVGLIWSVAKSSVDIMLHLPAPVVSAGMVLFRSKSCVYIGYR